MVATNFKHYNGTEGVFCVESETIKVQLNQIFFPWTYFFTYFLCGKFSDHNLGTKKYDPDFEIINLMVIFSTWFGKECAMTVIPSREAWEMRTAFFQWEI